MTAPGSGVTQAALLRSGSTRQAGGSIEEIAPGEVHLWTASTSGPLPPGTDLESMLAAGELAQAARFRFDAHRRRFLAARLARRRILAAYLRLAPAALAFQMGARGKPELAQPMRSGLCFNDTESEGLALLAVTRDRPVGVDVERLHHVPELERIIAGFASPDEKASFAGVCPEALDAAFIRWWTAKEAFLKALGDGLYRPLETFTVRVEPNGDVRLHGEAGWWLGSLQPAPGFMGAVVVEGLEPSVTIRHWPESLKDNRLR